MGEGSDAPIDPSALRTLFGDDADTIQKTLRKFIPPSNAIVQDIEDAFSTRSAAGVAAGAHKLKSSARAIGANALADLCQTLEAAGKAEDWDAITASVPSLNERMQEVSNHIDVL